MKSRFLESLAFDVEADGKLDGGYGTPALIENFLSGPAQASDYNISVYEDSKIDTTVLHQTIRLETLISPERSRDALSALLCL